MHRLSYIVVGLVAACSGEIDGPAQATGGDALVPGGMRRLSRDELDNTLADLLADDTRPAGRFVPEDAFTPFDNELAGQSPSPALIDGAESLARDVATRLLADPARRQALVGCTPSGPTDTACFERFVRQFGRRALRRPLAEAEVASFVALSAYAGETGDFYTGVETALWAFLQHPEFLYRVEVGSPVDGQDGVFRLGNHELMTRLSYLLIGSTPADGLLDAADAATAEGRLIAADELVGLAGQLLGDARAQRRVDRFHAMWLGYEQLGQDTALAAAMRRETRALVDRVVFEERRPWRDLFTFDETFVDAALAEHYGLPAPTDPAGGWVAYGDSGRRGILSHGSFLSNGIKFDDTSPVQRGLAVRVRLLCQEIPPPPDFVNADDPPAGDGPCKWDRYQATLGPGCAGCHAEINPAGWGLEEFDGLGRRRGEDASGCAIGDHAQGELVGLGEFRGPAELGALVADSAELRQCLGENLFRFVIGRAPSSDGDRGFIAAQLAGDELRFDDLLTRLVASPTFLHRVDAP